MKNNREMNTLRFPLKLRWHCILFLLCIFILNACMPRPALAPHHKIMHLDPYGSAIHITYFDQLKKRKTIEGEIIAVHNDSIIILTLEKDKLKTKRSSTIQYMERIKIHSYTVYYSKIQSSRIYQITSILTPLHGFFLVFSLPVNIAVFLSTENGEKNYFSKNHKSLPFKDLHFYARYPQGIPPGLDLNRITPRDYKKEKTINGY